MDYQVIIVTEETKGSTLLQAHISKVKAINSGDAYVDALMTLHLKGVNLSRVVKHKVTLIDA